MAFRFHQSLSGDNSKIAKCRCGVAGSAFPVDPTNPITSTSTRIPSCKPFAYVIVSVAALLATVSGINAWVFTAMEISRAMLKVGNLPRMFAYFVWRKGMLGLLLGVGAILLAINVFDLTALARIASATFLFSHMAVQLAHWHLVDETKGSRLLVGIGSLFMAAVLACFLWSTFRVQPWALVSIVAFVVGSWLIEFFLARSKVALCIQNGAH